MCVENVGARKQKFNLGIFSSNFCVKSRLTSLNPYFCCTVYLFGGSSSLITFEKIETFIYQSQKQNLALKLENF